MIKRAIREHLGFKLKHPWADLAYVAPRCTPNWPAAAARWITG
jgi:hypothetical protein